MSRLEELIRELCPDGVEYRKIGSIAKVLRGKRLTKNQLAADNKYPVYHGGLEPLGFYKEKNRDADTTMVINVGASAGTVGFCDKDFWSSDGCYCISHNDVTVPKFIYLALSCQEKYIVSRVRHAGIPTLDAKVIEELSIPVPPIEVQREIVRILDKFTTLTAELTAELTARQKQYNYYREKLLTYNEDVRWLTIADVCRKVVSGGTPQAGNPEYYGGNIPWLRTQEIDWHDICDTSIKITEAGLSNSSAKWIPANCVIVAMYGATAAKVAINKIPLTTNQACCNLEIDNTIALYRYVFHWLCKEYMTLKSLGQGSQSNINAQTVKNYKIPVPPLAVQQRIVNILDRFDAICNDFTSGLPAEIEARKKQYEYYRDKLLTFREV